MKGLIKHNILEIMIHNSIVNFLLLGAISKSRDICTYVLFV